MLRAPWEVLYIYIPAYKVTDFYSLTILIKITSNLYNPSIATLNCAYISACISGHEKMISWQGKK